MTIIGVEFKLKDIILIKIKLHICDTTGQERYKTIAKNFHKYSQGIIFVYDISSQISFDNLKNWMQNAKAEETDFKFIVIGNKNDKINERIIQFDSLFVTKTKYNVDNIFLAITEEIVKDLKEEYDSDLSISIDKSKTKAHKNNCCS